MKMFVEYDWRSKKSKAKLDSNKGMLQLQQYSEGAHQHKYKRF